MSFRFHTRSRVNSFAFSATLLLAYLNFGASSAYPASASGQAFNPDISANFLGLFIRESRGTTERTKTNRNGFSFQEGELQFTSDVDVYFRASALFSISQKDGTSDYGIDPEEAFLETISLRGVTFKGGKFKAAFGRHNQLHTHAFPFIDAPLINQDLLGIEGLNEPGVSAAILLPTPWFSELTAQVVSNANDAFYKSSNSGDVAGVVYFKNLWDLSDSLTFELGAFGTQGKNQYASTSRALGGDLVFKWRPSTGGKYHSLIWQTEYLSGNSQNNPGPTNLAGIATWIQFQFCERWWAQARYEYEGLPHSFGRSDKAKQSALLGFFPSEFSGFRLQYDHLKVQNQPQDHRLTFQYTVSIGAHPAHAY